MRKNFQAILSLLLLFSIGLACSEKESVCLSPAELGIKEINPNGESELALLMRAMFEEANTIKQQIANGEEIKTSLCHEQLLTAEATEPEKAASEQYKAYAKAFIQTVDHLQTSDPEHQLAVYENLVNNCLSCHKAMCPGPVSKIEKLR